MLLPVTTLRSKLSSAGPEPDGVRRPGLVALNNTEFAGRNLCYPNVLLSQPGELVSPYDERVMSLGKDLFYDPPEWEFKEVIAGRKTGEYFFFCYNVDNYFHFVYDTLPILYHYYSLKSRFPSIKLLLQTGHPTVRIFPPFVLETLELLGLSSDVELAEPDTVYETVFVGTSLTHGGFSNSPPSPEARDVWDRLRNAAVDIPCERSLPEKFYISRRSWVHGQTENLGTNYTGRRRCLNEDHLVEELNKSGYTEVFLELYSMKDKIHLFQNAESVVGCSGGGMCNLLFVNKEARAFCIMTPQFLDVNYRFKFSMDQCSLTMVDACLVAPGKEDISLYMRVKISDSRSDYYGCIGEVEGFGEGGTFVVRLSGNDVAGFSQSFPMETHTFTRESFVPLDKGLNSPFYCDVDNVLKTVRNNGG